MNFKLKTAALAAISAGALAGAMFASAQTAVTAYQCANGSLVTNPSACTTAVTTPANCFQFTQNLKVGSTGAQVMQLQKALNSLGFTVSASGAGSPGMESSYYGVLTGKAVSKFQEAHVSSILAPFGLTHGTGNFFASTRAYINANCGTGTTNPGNGNGNGTSTPSGAVTVSLSNVQPNNVMVAGSARNKMLNLSFSGTGVVTNITLQRTGISNNSAISNVYLLDNDTNSIIGGITSSVNNNGQVTFNNPSGLFTVAGTKNISVLTDLNLVDSTGASISGQSIGFSFTGYALSGSAEATVSGLNGPALPVGSATLAKVVVGTRTSAGTGINAGNPNVTLWSAPVTISNNNVNFSGISFTAIGSIPNNAFSNYKLFVDGNQAGNAVAMDNNMRVNFSFAPIALTTGGHTIELRADNQAGSGRQVNFSVNVAGDAMFQDANVGSYVSLTSSDTGCSTNWNLTCAQAPVVSIGNGALSVTQDSTWNPSTIVSGASNQTIAKYVVNTYGEDERVYSFSITPSIVSGVYKNGTATGSATVLNNLSLYINGSQVGSTVNQATSGATSTFNQTYVFPAGSVNSIEIKADMNTTVSGNTYPITAGTISASVSGTAYGNGINGANASGQSTNFVGSATGISAGAAAGSIGVYGATSKTISPNTNQQNLGSFIFQNGNNGSVTLNQLSIAAVVATSSFTDYRNVTLQMNGANLGTPYAYSAGTMNWNPSLTLAPNQSATFNLIADVGSVANTGSIVVTPTVQYTGSNVVNTITSASAVTNTINQASFSAPTVAGNTSLTQFIVGGSTSAVANFNLAVSQGNTTANELKFFVSSDSGATTAQTAVNQITVTVNGTSQTASVINGVADVTGLNIPLSTSNTNIQVSVATTCFGGTGNCNQSTLANNGVYVTLNYAKSNQAGVTAWTGTVTTTNPSYIVASMPTIAQTSGYSGSTSLNGGTQVLASYTIGANAAGAINLKKLAFTTTVSTAGSANISNLVLCTSTSCSTNVGDFTNATTTAAAGTTAYAFTSAGGYSIAAGQTTTFYVLGNVGGTFGTSGQTSISTQLDNAANFNWNEAIGASPTLRTGNGITNYPISSYSLKN